MLIKNLYILQFNHNFLQLLSTSQAVIHSGPATGNNKKKLEFLFENLWVEKDSRAFSASN